MRSAKIDSCTLHIKHAASNKLKLVFKIGGRFTNFGPVGIPVRLVSFS